MRAVDKIFPEDFIAEIQLNRALWDFFVEEYNNKYLKKKAWQNVILKFFPDFDERPLAERNEITAAIMTKWKGIRTCYARELLKQKSEKNDPISNGRKKYVYFDQLRFLDAFTKNGELNVAEEGEGENSWDEARPSTSAEKNNLVENNNPAEKNPAEKNNLKRSRDEDPISFPLKKAAIDIDYSNKRSIKTAGWKYDAEKSFLLSLLSEMHKVPKEVKLKLKTDLLLAISQAQGNLPHSQTALPDQNKGNQPTGDVHPPLGQCPTSVSQCCRATHVHPEQHVPASAREVALSANTACCRCGNRVQHDESEDTEEPTDTKEPIVEPTQNMGTAASFRSSTRSKTTPLRLSTTILRSPARALGLKRRASPTDSSLQTTFGTLMNKLAKGGEHAHQRDESAIFGDYVATKHRKYSSHTKSVVEHMISNVLFQADMGRYDSNPDSFSNDHLSTRSSTPDAVHFTLPDSNPLVTDGTNSGDLDLKQT